MRIQIQNGLGDAIYNYAVIKKLAETSDIKLETKFPDIFRNIDRVYPSTNKLDKVDLRLRWHVTNENVFDQLKRKSGVETIFHFDYNPIPIGFYTKGKLLCLLKEPVTAGYHKEKNDTSLASDPVELENWMHKNRDKYFYVSVGQNEKYLKRVKCDMDLTDKLSLDEFLSLCYYSDAMVSQIGHFIPIAAAFNKPIKIIRSISQNEAVFQKRKSCVLIKGQPEL